MGLRRYRAGRPLDYAGYPVPLPIGDSDTRTSRARYRVTKGRNRQSAIPALHAPRSPGDRRLWRDSCSDCPSPGGASCGNIDAERPRHCCGHTTRPMQQVVDASKPRHVQG